MGSESIRAEAGFEDLNTSVDRHLAYFRTRYFLSPSPIPSKPLLFTEHYFSDLPSISAVVWSKFPTEGTVVVADFPKRMVAQVQMEFSDTGILVKSSCKKKEMKVEYRLLNDIIAKSLTANVIPGVQNRVGSDRWCHEDVEFYGINEDDRVAPVLLSSLLWVAAKGRLGSIHALVSLGQLRVELFHPCSDCGSLRQSGPRPDPRLLRQAALEALTRSARTDSPRRVGRKQISGDNGRRRRRCTAGGGGGVWRGGEGRLSLGIQLAVGPQPLWLRNHNSGPAQWIMVKRLATSPHDPLGITDSACKNQSRGHHCGSGITIPDLPNGSW
ncbi:hypothetical protein F511_13441 [Dorcoceras hygrometricum]|uniref:Uncharacterized protein n=1 Tax=Dorcoceras hygrometricum TaxID=472368 RepID=A0A2Z7AFF2_9LAMI|nr:hypothetical protein F511_13441 [Dorcoceras hygrometricum]